jgi:hypothetical protein
MKKFILIIATVYGFIITQAQDRNFVRTYQSTVLPKGAIDLEFWHTSRFGHTGQFYNAQDQRMELEFGLGKNWQTAFYFNHYNSDIVLRQMKPLHQMKLVSAMNGK